MDTLNSNNQTYEESLKNYYLQCVTDFERAGDHVYSIARCGDQLREKGKSLSEAAIGELNKICVPLRELLDHTTLAFRKQNQEAARFIPPKERMISCPICGEANNFHAFYCKSCGKSLHSIPMDNNVSY